MAETELANTAAETPEGATERGRRQVLIGSVVSDKMDKTIVVAVIAERRGGHGHAF